MSEEQIILKRNGKLIHRQWDGNKQRYVNKRIKNITPFVLHERICNLQEGITLGDIFNFLNNNIDYWDAVLGNWCKEIVAEGCKVGSFPKDKDDWVIIENLELYWSCEISKHDDGISMESFNRPCFHGIGVYAKNDENGGYKKGQRSNIAVEFTPANELAQYEVKLNNSFDLWFWDYTSSKNPRRSIKKINYVGMTLFQIMYGIIWELSFSGPPVQRNKHLVKIQKSAKQAIKSFKAGNKHVTKRKK